MNENLQQSMTLMIFHLHVGFPDDDYIKDLTKVDVTTISAHGLKGHAYVKKMSKDKEPRWKSLFEELTGITDCDLTINSAPAVALIVTVDNHKFALTFGTGNYLLKDERITQDFGLKVCLANAGPDALKEMQYTQIENGVNRRNEQTSYNANVDSFGIDTDTNLLRKVTITPQDSTQGKNMTGQKGLKVSVDINPDFLPDLLRSFLKVYTDKQYQQSFKWIDNLRPVNERSIIDELDNALYEQIKQKNYKNLYIAPPDNLDYEKNIGFYIGEKPPSKEEYLPIIEYREFFDEIFEKNIERCLRDYKLYVGMEDDLFHKAQVNHCIVWETTLDGEYYVRYDNMYFSVGNGLMKELKTLDEENKPIEISLPKRKLSEGEGEYNQRVTENFPEYVLLDKKLANLSTIKGKYEICDLYDTRNNCFIHVKIDKSSSKLSHLFKQGTVSLNLLLDNSEARKGVKEVLRESVSDIEGVIDRKEYSVVYAIITNGAKEIKDLPMFSQISLYQTSKEFRRASIKWHICFIEEENI